MGAARLLRVLTAAGAGAAFALASPTTAHADAPRPHQLKYDVALDATVIGVSTALVLGSELVRSVKPLTCRWCDRDGESDRLNALDRWGRTLKWRDPLRAQFDSGVTAFLLEPAFAMVDMIVVAGADDADRAFPVDLLVISEAVAVSTFLNQATKLVFARERPFVHVLPPGDRPKTPAPSDNNVSFYSGHSALSFSLASAAGTVATLRGYRLMPLVWATLVPLAAATGYLRIAGDKHYLSDVLTGAVLGTAVGVALPLLFHGRERDDRVPIGSGAAPVAPLHAQTPMVSLGGGF
jgi:membrane-associated phospholipid phosphatase